MLESSRRVRISLGGEVVAETDRPKILFEPGLPPSYYIPPEDVRQGFLLASETITGCPYKGTASYYSVEAGGERAEDVVWYYPEPLPEARKARDHLCFYDEKLDVELDGEPQTRPVTPFS